MHNLGVWLCLVKKVHKGEAAQCSSLVIGDLTLETSTSATKNLSEYQHYKTPVKPHKFLMHLEKGWDPLQCFPQTTLLATNPVRPITHQNTSCSHEIQYHKSEFSSCYWLSQVIASMPIPMWVYQTFTPHIMLLLLGSWLPRTRILLELLLSPKSQWTSSQAEFIRHTTMLWATGKGEDDSATLSSLLLWQISGLFEPAFSSVAKNQEGWTSQSFAMLFGEAKSLHTSKIQVW